MFVVVTQNLVGEFVPLRGTVWAFHMDRAQKFETREAAQAALDKAKKFMKAKTYKAARIIEVAPLLMAFDGKPYDQGNMSEGC